MNNTLNLKDLNDKKIDIEQQISLLESEKQTLKEEMRIKLNEIKEKNSEIIDLQKDLNPYEELEEELGMDLSCASRNLTLIEEGSFENYCKELCEEIGDIPKDLPCYIKDAIDWEQVANSIRVDYSTVEWDGGTYLWIE